VREGATKAGGGRRKRGAYKTVTSAYFQSKCRLSLRVMHEGSKPSVDVGPCSNPTKHELAVSCLLPCHLSLSSVGNAPPQPRCCPRESRDNNAASCDINPASCDTSAASCDNSAASSSSVAVTPSWLKGASVVRIPPTNCAGWAFTKESCVIVGAASSWEPIW
jgi:hypothetical protein